jgi:ADP-ribose pyrophosphatase YjhB (NUDIX family)
VPTAAFYAALPKRYAGAGAYITNKNGELLVVKPNYKPGWELPGGVVETGETPADTCARECHEELGLDITVGRLLAIEHQSLEGRGDSTMYLYDGGVIDSRAPIVLPPGELDEYRFVRPSSIGEFLPARIAPRVLAAQQARADGSLRELCGGETRVLLG